MTNDQINDKMRKSVKIACWLVGIPVALLFLVMALSPVVKSVVNHHGQDILGRDMSVNRVFVNPFFGTVTIQDFHCKEADGLVDFVAFERLYVQINWLALMGKHANLRHIHLDQFSGEILSGEEEFNFTDIINRFASKDTTVQDTAPSKWTVSLRDIQLHNGRLVYHDLVRDNRWSVDDVNLNVPGLYFGRQQSNAGMQFNLPTGGSVTITAGYVMASHRYAVTLRLDEVNTNVALPLVRDYLNIKGLGALVTGNIHIDGSLNDVRDLVASGALSLTGLNITDEDDEPVAGLDEVRLVILKGDVANNNFLLDTLTITGITGHFEHTAKSNTLSRILREREQVPDTTSHTKAVSQQSGSTSNNDAALSWSTRHLCITAHDISFDDRSMSKRFKYALDTLSVTGSNIASHGKNSIDVLGRFSDGARLNASYIGGLYFKQGNHRLNAKLINLQLPQFTLYTEELFACPIDSGELALQVDATIYHGKLNCENKITIDHPEIGKKAMYSKAKYKNIPLKLGVDLLKSAQGVVVLDVPVKGDLNSPKFKLGKVVGRAIAKVFFGPLMGVRDNRKLISADEREEMMEILGSDTTELMSLAPPAESQLPADSKKRKNR